MAHNVEFKSIKEIDLSKLEFPQVAVYSNLSDYPGKAVAKIMDNGKKDKHADHGRGFSCVA